MQIAKLKTERGHMRMAKKKKPEEEGMEFDFGIGGLFKGIGNLIDLVSKMAEEGRGEVSREGEIKGLGKKVKGVYGFTIRTLAGGIPRVEPFGNIKETPGGPVIEEVREPVVDVFDEEAEVLVIAEMPGVAEEKIKIDVKGDVLNISAENKDRKYAKEVLLPCAVDAEATKVSYKNGIVEITLPKLRGKES